MTEVEPFRLPVAQPDEYPNDKRVRLRGDRTAVYSLARAGAEGWVRAQRYDPIGKYRMVFIEWDDAHWSYNEQSNMWAFEDHFELASKDDDMSLDDADTKQLLKELLTRMGDEDRGEGPEDPTTSENRDKRDDLDLDIGVEDQTDIDADEFTPASDEQYFDTLRAAIAAAKDADSFLLVAVVRQESQQGDALIPQVYKSDRAEDAGLLLGSQVTGIGGIIHQDLATESIRRVRSK